MPDFWYEQKFDLGNGEKFSLMHIDSCFLLCEIISKQKSLYFERLDADSKNVFQKNCEHTDDPTYRIKADEQMKWIKEISEANLQDSSIAWKASFMHHPMYAIT
jgi:hypothetical protein